MVKSRWKAACVRTSSAAESRCRGRTDSCRHVSMTLLNDRDASNDGPPMSSSVTAPPHETVDRDWFIVGRWQEFAGEERANLLRTIGVGLFYIIELINRYGVHLSFLQIEATADRDFHLAATGLAVTWALVALFTLLCLRSQVFPGALKYITTGCDIVLLTTIIALGNGPRSPLVLGYLLIIVLAGLRFKLRLIWCATIASIAGYLFLLGYAKWNIAGRELSVPRYEQLIVLLSLALAGVILGQIIRRVRSMAEDYARRLKAAQAVQP